MEKQIKPIQEEPKEQPKLDNNKKIITKLPEWSIVPPLNIKRGK